MKPIQSHSKSTEPTEIIDIDDCDDRCACLINNSDSDVKCKLSLLFHDITDIGHSESMMWLTIPHNPTINSHPALISPYMLAYHHARFNSGSSCLLCFSR
jgi:hypothetical protein